MARTLGYYSLADKAKALIDSDIILVTEAGDRNVDLSLIISRRAVLANCTVHQASTSA